MDANDVARYTALFQNALVYTVSIRILDHIISTSDISALPFVIMTVLGIVTLIVQGAGALTAQAQRVAATASDSSVAHALDLAITLLRLATDVLVQFLGQAVSRSVLDCFSDSASDTATFTGVVIGVTLLHALTRAASRRPAASSPGPR